MDRGCGWFGDGTGSAVRAPSRRGTPSPSLDRTVSAHPCPCACTRVCIDVQFLAARCPAPFKLLTRPYPDAPDSCASRLRHGPRMNPSASRAPGLAGGSPAPLARSPTPPWPGTPSKQSNAETVPEWQWCGCRALRRSRQMHGLGSLIFRQRCLDRWTMIQ